MSRIEKILQAMIDETSYDEAPQSRIEAILLAIKNNTQYSYLPYGRIEEILLAIKNNTSYDKEPMSRIEEILLAKLNLVEYKKPVQSKIEKLLLKWLYQDLYLTLKGVPPLTFTANGQPLVDWTIYGNTVNGESVGDRTANLFANLWKKGYIRADNGREEQIDGFICSGFFPVEYGHTYSISRNINVGYDNIRGYRDDESFIGAGTAVCDVNNPFPNAATKIGAFTVTNENVAFIRFNDSANDLGMKYMIVKGTYTEQTMPDYEPYGYKVPVTVSNGTDTLTTPIYLPEQLRMVGTEAEYIDYGEQKQHRVRKNLAKNNYAVSSDWFTAEEVNNFIHVSGTNNSGITRACIISKENIFPAGSYDMVNNSDTIIQYDYIDENGTLVYGTVSANSIKTFNFPAVITRSLNIYKGVLNGESIDNHFQIMVVRHGTDASTYEPYIENTELDVALPEIPALTGTNTLTVGTEVQPSNMEIIYAPKEPELKLMMKKKLR